MSQFRRRTREEREAEEALLAPAAARSVHSRGRALPESPDPYRTCFERDRDRILHSKAFRRLKHKTQVFIDPAGDHVVTRLTHALQVTQVARALAAGLGLNEVLAEAIALGHDVGHPPFGHIGEEALAPYAPGWHHAAQSVRIYDVLERANLTEEVRDGIRAHSWRITPPPSTAEGACVRFADRIAYLTHDMLDAVRAGLLDGADLPTSVRHALGPPSTDWIGVMIEAVFDGTHGSDRVTMPPDALAVMDELREFLFARVYLSARNEEQKRTAIAVLRRLVDHHLRHPEQVPLSYRDEFAPPLTQVLDYVAGMTDRYALAVHERLFGTADTAALRPLAASA